MPTTTMNESVAIMGLFGYEFNRVDSACPSSVEGTRIAAELLDEVVLPDRPKEGEW